MSRTAEIERATAETTISLRLDLDGAGAAELDTGIGFLDHMLAHVARHGFFDLMARAKGDLHVDPHHTVEDVGIALGQALRQACGDKRGMARYGQYILPMDEALVLCSLDLSGRPYLGFDLELCNPRLGGFDTELTQEFFRAISTNAGMNLHLRQLAGGNTHHVIEATFKAFGRALDAATRMDPRLTDVPSTKGIL